MAYINKQFTFDVNLEGWSSSTPLPANMTYERSTAVSPINSLRINYSPYTFISSVTTYWKWIGTWEDLGVAHGDIVTTVRLINISTRCKNLGTGASVNFGPLGIYKSGTNRVSLWSGRSSVTATDPGWVSLSDLDKTVPSDIQHSTNSIELRLHTTLNNVPSYSTNNLFYDDIHLLITTISSTTYNGQTLLALPVNSYAESNSGSNFVGISSLPINVTLAGKGEGTRWYNSQGNLNINQGLYAGSSADGPVFQSIYGGRLNQISLAARGTYTDPTDLNRSTLYINGYVDKPITYNPLDAQKNCLLWVKSDTLTQSDGEIVKLWEDQSGSGNNLINNYDEWSPILKTNIFYDKWSSVRFSGGEYLQNAAINTNSPDGVTIFAVLKNASSGTQTNILNLYNNWGVGTKLFKFNDTNIPYDLDNNTHVLSIRQDGIGTSIIDNDNLIFFGAEGSPSFTSGQSLCVGADWSVYDFLSGDIAEILIYDGALDDTDRIAVHKYLLNKYNSGDDISPYVPLSMMGTALDNISNVLPLYTSTGDLSYKNINLFLRANDLPTSILVKTGQVFQPSHPNLYIKGSTGSHIFSNTTLYTKGFAPESTSTMNLYVEQHSGSESLPLRIIGAPVGVENLNKQLDLSIIGHSSISSTLVPLTLYMGTLVGANSTLYISGPISIGSTTSLYTQGPLWDASNINLFLAADPIITYRNNLELQIYGGTDPILNSFVFNSLELSLPQVLAPSATLNLFVDGIYLGGSSSGSLNMAIRGDLPVAFGSTPLFLLNKNVRLESSTNMFIKGYGKTPGYIPALNTVNLFIDGYGSGPLTTPILSNLIMTLFVNGKYSFSYNIDGVCEIYMQVPESYQLDANTTLFIEGANPPTIESAITLVIYKTMLSKSATLYVHGF